jgi:uncharacterized protein
MKRRILSIDGGGIKGAYAASVLASIENGSTHSIGRYFDLIVGTSTGGIIALGLGAGLRAADIVEFYREHGPRIFAGSRITRLLRQLGIAKYDNVELRKALESTLEGRTIADSRVRLVIPSASLESGRIHLYKTPHHSRLTTDRMKSMVEAALATAAAPAYFPVTRATSGLPLVDGGLFANNPMGIAATEATSLLGWAPTDCTMLSIGCTQERPDLSAAGGRAGAGGLYWLGRAIGFMMSAQSSLALGTAQHLIGHERVYRINETVAAGRFRLDRASDLPALIGLGAESAREWKPRLMSIFFSEPAEPFVAPSLENRA